MVSPSGRLPIIFDRRWKDNPSYDSYYPQADTDRVVYKEGVFVGYRGYEKNQIAPLFPFGFGLSYTTFRYSQLEIEPVGDGGTRFDVSFDVTNTGQRQGADVAQVYVGDQHATVPRPPKELKGFARVDLEPGETKRVSIALDRRSFAYYDVASAGWRVDPGSFDVLVGRSSANIVLRGSVEVAQ